MDTIVIQFVHGLVYGLLLFLVASGLTFLETVANPYTTVLGPPRYAAARINTAQSCNGVGWIFGPIAGSMFFYGTDAAGRSTGSQTLWIPYAGVAVGVLILATIFFFAPVPDVKAEDDYHLDDKDNGAASASAYRRELGATQTPGRAASDAETYWSEA